MFFLEGGGNILEGDLEKIDRLAISKSSNKDFLIIDLSTTDKNKIDKYKLILKEYFKKLGADKLFFASEIKDLEEFNNIINEVGIMYLPGGDTELLLTNIKKLGYDKLIKKYNGIIIGNSAGSLILCKKTILTKDKNINTTKVIKGIGLLEFSLEVHYDGSQDEELNKLKDIGHIYLIPEKCALIYTNDGRKFLGNIKMIKR